MESMQNTRQFKVEINADELIEVLQKLQNYCGGKISQSIVLNLNLADTKETYRILNSDPGILDWNFEEEEIKEQLTTKKKKEEKKSAKETTTVGDVLKIFPIEEPTSKSENNEIDDNLPFLDYIVLENTDGLIRYIEAVWNVAKTTPNIRFGTSLFMEQFLKFWNKINEEEYLKTDLNNSITRSMMKLLIDVFYNSPYTKEEVVSAFNDTVERIRDSFNSLKSAETLNQVMNILYRHERKKI